MSGSWAGTSQSWLCSGLSDDYFGIAWLFWGVSTVQMMSWAAKKQRAYKKDFGKEYPRQRKAMIPFLF